MRGYQYKAIARLKRLNFGSKYSLQSCLVALGAPPDEIYADPKQAAGTGWKYRKIKPIRKVLSNGEILEWAHNLYRQKAKELHRCGNFEEGMKEANLAFERVKKILGNGT